jgi:ribosome-binding protein aMBF1 (putative translation factor)
MSIEQDWTPMILRKNKPKPNASVQHAPGFKKQQNILSDDPEAPKILGSETGKQILQARNAKGLTQVDLARQINVQANIIRDYETGKIVPDKRVLRLICKKLDIKIVC